MRWSVVVRWKGDRVWTLEVMRESWLETRSEESPSELTEVISLGLGFTFER
jgi:hypothetical protein